MLEGWSDQYRASLTSLKEATIDYNVINVNVGTYGPVLSESRP